MTDNTDDLLDLIDRNNIQREYSPREPRVSIHARTQRGITAMIFEADNILIMEEMAKKWRDEKPHRANMNFIMVLVNESLLDI